VFFIVFADYLVESLTLYGSCKLAPAGGSNFQ